MLSRHADSLFWLARYVERAENTARLIETASRLSSMPVANEETRNEWEVALSANGSLAAFQAMFGEVTPAAAFEFLAFSTLNTASICSCIEAARQNARTVRTALTIDMWEAINSAWLEMKRFRPESMTRPEASAFLGWVKEVSLRFDGSAHRTMLRNDAYFFERIGLYIERADATARILAAKADVLAPGQDAASGSYAYYQWSSILRSVGALTSYHWVYRQNVKPELVADLMIRSAEMPRSLVSCYENMTRHLDHIAQAYGRQGYAQRTARTTLSRLQNTDLSTVFETGLESFLDGFTADNNRLGEAITDQYLT
jgi:uncharacterized alpha-E superfamily protein